MNNRTKNLAIAVAGSVALLVGLLFAIITTTGKSDDMNTPTPTVSSTPEPTSSSTSSSTPAPSSTTGVTAPAIFDFEQEVPADVTAFMMVYRGQVIVLKPKSPDTVEKWTVQASDPTLVKFTPGSIANGVTNNPSVVGIKNGQVNLTITDGVAQYRLMISISDPETTPAPKASPDAKATKLAATLVGKNEKEASDAVLAAGLAVRVVQRDGEDLPSTMDYRPDRVNLSIDKGLVIKATVG